MILDTGFNIFIWEGKKSNKKERAFSQSAARKYCNQFNRPKQMEVVRCREGGENEIFTLFCTHH